MAHWNLNDIPWHQFNPQAVNPKHIALVKAACMVEHNSDTYGEYLRRVFADDAEFCAETHRWAAEEVQHGQALRRWAEMVDPTFQFPESFSNFTEGYQQLPTEVDESVRGSRCGELIARCVVESGTSTYYTALMEATNEPVLKAICAKIAADEYRHYQLFYRFLKHYGGELSLWQRFRIAVARVTEIEDDELPFAFHSAHDSKSVYNHKQATRAYYQHLGHMYHPKHIARMCAMVLRAVGLKPNGKLHRTLSNIAWKAWKWRASPPSTIAQEPFAIA